MSGERWEGTLVVETDDTTRSWDPDAIAALQEVAGWIANHWPEGSFAAGVAPLLPLTTTDTA